MTTKRSRVRIPRYTGEEGEYLAIDENDLTVGWYFPDSGAFGLRISNASPGYTYYSTNVVMEALRTFFQENKLSLPYRGEHFVFEHMDSAIKALKLCNAVLYYWRPEHGLPEWVYRALAAGWSPPKGWKP